MDGQYYFATDIPFQIDVSAGGTVFPEMTIVDGNGEINKYDMTVWKDENNAIVKANVYVLNYRSYSYGIHRYSVTVYNDAGKTVDVTSTRLCGMCPTGGFVIINNPLDEIVTQHTIDGSLGWYIFQIMSFLLLYEHPGNGDCPVDIEIANGHGVALVVKEMSTNNVVAREVLDSTGKTRVFLSTGTYIFEYYPPCGKTMENVREIRKVSCSGSTAQCS